MITQQNYFSSIKNIDFTSLPEGIRKGHDLINKTTSGGTDWSSYNISAGFKKMVDVYLKTVETYLNKIPAPVTTSTATIPHQAVAPVHTIRKVLKQNATEMEAASSSNSESKTSKLIERIPDEIRFMKRYIHMDGLEKTKDDLLRFISSLQKAILERRIRKTSPYAKQIKNMQTKLIAAYNNMGNAFKVSIDEKTIDEFENLIDGENIYPSVKLIKRYINICGKPGMKHKAELLKKQMAIAVGKNKITKADPYAIKLSELFKNLCKFIDTKKQTELVISETELNGLNGILGHCGCHAVNGFDEDDEMGDAPKVMNSMDFANLHFNTIGLKGKWFDLIGDPSPNFTAMVFGKPKMGKSYLCVDFAGYLARNHGKVLYVAKEEGLDYTLQQKLNDKNVKHPNLFVADELPSSLSAYDFIFLDSVNKLGLKPAALKTLKKQYPTKSFIYIFQSTKEGNFRGANEFQHDVDVVIEIPERGKAVQFGRFNQGGEVKVF